MQQIESLYVLVELKYVTSLMTTRTKPLNCSVGEYDFRSGHIHIMVPFMASFTFNHPIIIFWLAAAAIHSEVLTVS